MTWCMSMFLYLLVHVIVVTGASCHANVNFISSTYTCQYPHLYWWVSMALSFQVKVTVDVVKPALLVIWWVSMSLSFQVKVTVHVVIYACVIAE